jgi:hypothetical protein
VIITGSVDEIHIGFRKETFPFLSPPVALRKPMADIYAPPESKFLILVKPERAFYLVITAPDKQHRHCDEQDRFADKMMAMIFHKKFNGS